MPLAFSGAVEICVFHVCEIQVRNIVRPHTPTIVDPVQKETPGRSCHILSNCIFGKFVDNKGLHKNAVSRFFVIPVILFCHRNIDFHGFFHEFIYVNAKPCVHAVTLLLQITLCKIDPSMDCKSQ